MKHRLYLLLALTLAACAPVAAEPLPTLVPTLPPLGQATSLTPLGEVTDRPTATIPPTRTMRPTWTPLPTRTPWPTIVPPPTQLPTATALPGNRTTIGYSLGGRPIDVYQFGEGPVKKLIIAGIHGGYEWNTIHLARELILTLNAFPERIPPDVTLYIVPAVNVDGYARSRGVDGQMNDRGVDLNRNWPSNWMADWPRSGCWIYRPVTGGTAPLSEPETRALADFITQHQFEASISYHSAALGIFAGGYDEGRPSIRLAEALAAVTTYSYPPFDTGCYYTGQFTDWMADLGAAAVDVELTNHRDIELEMNLRLLDVFLSWRK